MKTTYAVNSVVGTVRRNNQDNFYLNGVTKPVQQPDIALADGSGDEAQVFALCDGMGGESSGELAASLAVETLKSYPHGQFADRWREYVSEANRRVCDFQREHRIRMGTTYTGLFLRDGMVQIVNVGDSRAYRIRNGEITQLSRDHTEFQLMVEAGLLRVEDFSKTVTHNHLTQNIGIEPENMELEPFVTEPEQVQEGDCYLLCSDGLYGAVPDTELLRLTNEISDPSECCKKLIELAEEQGSRDNITALLIRVSLKTEQPASGTDTKNGTKKRRFVPILAGIIVLALLAGGGYYLWNYPVVPDVTGEIKDDAVELLEEQGFLVLVSEEEIYSDTVQKGEVLSQSPESGSRARRGSSITLGISCGAEPVSVPNVVGMTEKAASEELEKAGFDVDATGEAYDDNVVEGSVISQTPKAGESTQSGGTVKITISLGRENEEAQDQAGSTTEKKTEKKVDTIVEELPQAQSGQNQSGETGEKEQS